MAYHPRPQRTDWGLMDQAAACISQPFRHHQYLALHIPQPRNIEEYLRFEHRVQHCDQPTTEFHITIQEPLLCMSNHVPLVRGACAWHASHNGVSGRARAWESKAHLNPFVRYTSLCPAWVRASASKGLLPRNMPKTARISFLLRQRGGVYVILSLRLPGVITAPSTANVMHRYRCSQMAPCDGTVMTTHLMCTQPHPKTGKHSSHMLGHSARALVS